MVTMNNPILKIDNISKSFKGVERLKKISFSIYKGDFLILAGSNGSGKTLLMKHLNGLYKIKKGSIFFNGEDCHKKENLMKSRIGLIFQNPDNQIVGLTVEDDIAFGPQNLGLSKKDVDTAVENAMNTMNITHLRHRNPHTLSGGEKKRVTISGVLAMNPSILIFDEPFIGLDYPGVISVTEAILSLKNKGETIIVITHDLEKILAYGTRLLVMNNGEIVADGIPEKLINDLEKWGIRRPTQQKIKDMTWLK